MEDGRIARVGAASEVEPPEGLLVVEGGYVIPSLFDLHVHLAGAGRVSYRAR